jgi:hypothetical protein
MSVEPLALQYTIRLYMGKQEKMELNVVKKVTTIKIKEEY